MTAAANKICYDGCPVIIDATCVVYTGEDLTNIGVSSDDTLHEILEILDALSFSETTFTAISTNSIIAVAGGTNGHSPSYSVRVNNSVDNQITVSENGLFVSIVSESDGKVKVDSSDTKAYLEDQFGPASDGASVLTVTPTKVSGKIQFVPFLHVINLLEEIQNNYQEEFCEIVYDCIIHTV